MSLLTCSRCICRGRSIRYLSIFMTRIGLLVHMVLCNHPRGSWDLKGPEAVLKNHQIPNLHGVLVVKGERGPVGANPYGGYIRIVDIPKGLTVRIVS